MNKTTDELMNIIKTKDDFTQTKEEIVSEQITESLSECLNRMIAEKGVALSEVLHKSGIKKAYFYNLFNGDKKNPSRDICIQLCFGFGLSLEETQNFLKRSGHSVLYPRVPRDSVLIYCFLHKMTLIDSNLLLLDNNEQLLG